MDDEVSEVPAGIRVFPNTWPGPELRNQPGDVTKFALMGCYGGPLTMRVAEEDDEDSEIASDARVNGLHPVHDAPLTESRGGVFYFDSFADTDEVMVALKLIGVDCALRDYAVFVTGSSLPIRDRFIIQCKLVPSRAFDGFYYGADPLKMPGGSDPQPLDLGEFCRGFIEVQKRRWDTRYLEGADAEERWELGFGFLMENPFSGACRIWSRPWLLGK